MILVKIYKKLTQQHTIITATIIFYRYNLKSNIIIKGKKANKLAQAKTYSKRSPLEDVGT